MTDRLKLFITEVKEPRTVGQAEVLDFLAHPTGDTKTARYSVWSKSLYEYIKKDATLDCDVETKQSDKKDLDGNPYVSRRITQIYINEKPVITGQARSGFQRRSPEERLSIEQQVSVKIGAELFIAGKIEAKHPLTEATITWCLNKLGLTPANRPQEVSVTPTSVSEKQQPEATKTEPSALMVNLPFDPTWLIDSLKAVKWTEKISKSYLGNVFKVDTTGSIIEVVARLTDEQRQKYFAEIESRLKEVAH